jgi:hypothetical protein
MNITSLGFQVTARLWELLADASIVGQAQRPASWLATTRNYLCNTCDAMSDAMEAYSAAWLKLKLAHEQDTPPAPSAQLQVESVGQAAVERGHQLSSLAPAVPWDRLHTAAYSIGGAGGQDVVGLLLSMESAWFRAQAAEHEHTFTCIHGQRA